jgi:hypothetical protein
MGTTAALPFTALHCTAALIDRTALANTILERVLQESSNSPYSTSDESGDSQTARTAEGAGSIAIYFEHSLVGLDADSRTATFETAAGSGTTTGTQDGGRVAAQ